MIACYSKSLRPFAFLLLASLGVVCARAEPNPVSHEQLSRTLDAAQVKLTEAQQLIDQLRNQLQLALSDCVSKCDQANSPPMNADAQVVAAEQIQHNHRDHHQAEPQPVHGPPVGDVEGNEEHRQLLDSLGVDAIEQVASTSVASSSAPKVLEAIGNSFASASGKLKAWVSDHRQPTPGSREQQVRHVPETANVETFEQNEVEGEQKHESDHADRDDHDHGQEQDDYESHNNNDAQDPEEHKTGVREQVHEDKQEAEDQSDDEAQGKNQALADKEQPQSDEDGHEGAQQQPAAEVSSAVDKQSQEPARSQYSAFSTNSSGASNPISATIIDQADQFGEPEKGHIVRGDKNELENENKDEQRARQSAKSKAARSEATPTATATQANEGDETAQSPQRPTNMLPVTSLPLSTTPTRTEQVGDLDSGGHDANEPKATGADSNGGSFKSAAVNTFTAVNDALDAAARSNPFDLAEKFGTRMKNKLLGRHSESARSGTQTDANSVEMSRGEEGEVSSGLRTAYEVKTETSRAAQRGDKQHAASQDGASVGHRNLGAQEERELKESDMMAASSSPVQMVERLFEHGPASAGQPEDSARLSREFVQSRPSFQPPQHHHQHQQEQLESFTGSGELVQRSMGAKVESSQGHREQESASFGASTSQADGQNELLVGANRAAQLNQQHRPTGASLAPDGANFIHNSAADSATPFTFSAQAADSGTGQRGARYERRHRRFRSRVSSSTRSGGGGALGGSNGNTHKDCGRAQAGARWHGLWERMRSNGLINGLVEKTKTHVGPRARSAGRHLGETGHMLTEGAERAFGRFHRAGAKRRRLNEEDRPEAALEGGESTRELPRGVRDMLGRLPQVPPISEPKASGHLRHDHAHHRESHLTAGLGHSSRYRMSSSSGASSAHSIAAL